MGASYYSRRRVGERVEGEWRDVGEATGEMRRGAPAPPGRSDGDSKPAAPARDFDGVVGTNLSPGSTAPGSMAPARDAAACDVTVGGGG